MENLQQLKDSINLRDTVESFLGKGEKHYDYTVFSCFLHSDRSPSLTVWDDHWYCFGCKHGGSIFDFLMEYKHVTFKEAVEECKTNITPTSLPKINTQQRPSITIPMSLVQENASHINEGLSYFHERGISDPTSYRIPLGVKTDYKSSYQMKDGTWIEILASRYAVPNIYEDKVIGINYRRNDVAFLESFFNHPSHGKIIDDLKAKRGDEYRDKDILDFVAGAKYKQEPGSQWKMFNKQRIAKREDGKTVFKSIPYLLLHPEPKEFDTLGLESAGYPSVGVMLKREFFEILPTIFNKISLLYIIRDNDEAGFNNAVMLQNILGRGRIISPIEGKDTGDTIKAGLLTKWMNQFGLEPILGV